MFYAIQYHKQPYKYNKESTVFRELFSITWFKIIYFAFLLTIDEVVIAIGLITKIVILLPLAFFRMTS